MRMASHMTDVERTLRDAMRADKARHDIGRISRLGLLEVSRQRLRPAASASSYTACPMCEGHGAVRTPESAALVALRKIHHRIAEGDIAQMKVGLPRDVAMYLLNQKRDDLAVLEARYAARIQVVVDDKLMPHQSEIETRTRDVSERPVSILRPGDVPTSAVAMPANGAARRIDAARPATARAEKLPAARSGRVVSEAAGEESKQRRRRRRGGRDRKAVLGEGGGESVSTDAAERVRHADRPRAGARETPAREPGPAPAAGAGSWPSAPGSVPDRPDTVEGGELHELAYDGHAAETADMGRSALGSEAAAESVGGGDDVAAVPAGESAAGGDAFAAPASEASFADRSFAARVEPAREAPPAGDAGDVVTLAERGDERADRGGVERPVGMSEDVDDEPAAVVRHAPVASASPTIDTGADSRAGDLGADAEEATFPWSPPATSEPARPANEVTEPARQPIELPSRSDDRMPRSALEDEARAIGETGSTAAVAAEEGESGSPPRRRRRRGGRRGGRGRRSAGPGSVGHGDAPGAEQSADASPAYDPDTAGVRNRRRRRGPATDDQAPHDEPEGPAGPPAES